MANTDPAARGESAKFVMGPVPVRNDVGMNLKIAPPSVSVPESPGRSSSPAMTTLLGNNASPSHAMHGSAVRLMTFDEPVELTIVAAAPQPLRAVTVTSLVVSGLRIS